MSALTSLTRHRQCSLAIRMRTRRGLAQGLAEYGLIIAFVAVLAIASLLLFRPALPSLLSTLSTSV
ncbi:MAG: hypothetical protein M3069_05085 [Chloroflexota bacterium]|nr:hypothetical protein [Chloroflexota bacterium]